MELNLHSRNVTGILPHTLQFFLLKERKMYKYCQYNIDYCT
ncbi:hypothetical protein MIDIC_310043 [Alphaproteobacteria bacterium]